MNDHFLKLKANLELDATLAGVISTRHNAIREYVKNNHAGALDSKLIGSHQRQTRIRPSDGSPIDIDIVVTMGQFDQWVQSGGVNAHDALRNLYATLAASDRYGDMQPVQDSPTVALASSGNVKIEIVPAYIDNIGFDPSGTLLGSPGRGYWIAKDRRWQMADYDHEAAYITEQNKLSAGWLIPSIKMLKAIKRIYFPQLASFPLEILAAAVIPPMTCARTLLSPPITYPELLLAFFDRTPQLFGAAIQVPGSKSAPITLDLTTQQSLGKMFGEIAVFIRATQVHATRATQVENWRKLFGDAFPARV